MVLKLKNNCTQAVNETRSAGSEPKYQYLLKILGEGYKESEQHVLGPLLGVADGVAVLPVVLSQEILPSPLGAFQPVLLGEPHDLNEHLARRKQ